MEFLEEVEQSGKWPQQPCTTVFFLIPKNVRSERPMALMPTMMRCAEATGSGEMASEVRIDLDASDERNGGAQSEQCF